LLYYYKNIFYNGIFFTQSFGWILLGGMEAVPRRERRGVYEKHKAEKQEFLFVDKSSDREHGCHGSHGFSRIIIAARIRAMRQVSCKPLSTDGVYRCIEFFGNRIVLKFYPVNPVILSNCAFVCPFSAPPSVCEMRLRTCGCVTCARTGSGLRVHIFLHFTIFYSAIIFCAGFRMDFPGGLASGARGERRGLFEKVSHCLKKF